MAGGHPPRRARRGLPRGSQDHITWSKRDQLDRASLSVSNNIADVARERGDGLRRRRWSEATRRAARTGCPLGGPRRNGFECGTTNELLAFLYIARGSAGEVRSMGRFFERRPRLHDPKSHTSDLISTGESCSRQIPAWVDSLQNSEIAGPRHLNDKARATGADAFNALLLQHLPLDRPLHPDNPFPGKAPLESL